MEFGNGFPSLKERKLQVMGLGMPITPEKPIPTTSNPAQADGFGEPLERGSSQELAGFPGGQAKEPPKENEFNFMRSWMPVTPEKLIPTKPSPAQADGSGEHVIGANSRELAGIPDGHAIQSTNDTTTVTNLSPIGQGGGNEGYTGSNKTPEQKPPKRRKHRPKVVKEGKPKRTPEADISKSTNPGGKRKYVCRKAQDESATQKADVMGNSTGASATSVETLCRRSLNFDLENHVAKSQVEAICHHTEMQQSDKRTFDLNLDSQATEIDSGTKSQDGTKSTFLIGQQRGLHTESQQPRKVDIHTSVLNPNPAYVPTISINPNPAYTQERLPVAASLPREEDLHTISINVVASEVDINLRGQFRQSRRSHTSIQQHSYGKGIDDVVNQEKENMMTQCFLQSAPKTWLNSKQVGQSKREYSNAVEQSHPYTVTQLASFLKQNIVQLDECHGNRSIQSDDCSETHKKRKIHNGLHTIITNSPVKMTAKAGSREAQRKNGSIVRGNGSMLEESYNVLNSCFTGSKLSNREQSRYTKLFCDWDASSKKHSGKGKMGKTTLLASVRACAPSVPRKKRDIFPVTPPVKAPALGNWQHKRYRTNVLANQYPQPIFNRSVSSGVDRVQLVQTVVLFDLQQYSAKRRGTKTKKIYPIPSVNEITNKFKHLNLHGWAVPGKYQEQNAIVPYKQDGAVVMYEGFEFIKKKKPRPKVDLDPETNRIWNLLMGKEGGEGVEETDKTKERWEEERRVFKGRADSFIARMHLVQGDRRFSRWKGSVVDSVIGVFLTQNVSDHLSSSAFMSLAARFPLKLNKKTCNLDGTTMLVEEPEEVCAQSEKESIQWHEQLLRNLSNSHSSITSPEPTENQRDTSVVGKTSITELHGLEDEILSTQDSFSSTILQNSGGIRSHSGSNSEAEDSPSVCKLDSGSANFQPVGNPTLFQNLNSCINDSPLFHERYSWFKHSEDGGNPQQESRLYSKDCLKGSLTFTQLLHFFNSPQNHVVPSSDSELHMNSYSELLEAESLEVHNGDCIYSNCAAFPEMKNGCYARTQQLADEKSETTVQQDGLSTHEKLLPGNTYSLSKKHPMQQLDGLPGCPPMCDTSFSDIYQHERTRNFECESLLITGPLHHAEKNDSMQHVQSGTTPREKASDMEEKISVANTLSDNRLIGPNSGEQVLSVHKVYDETNPNTSKSKKRKADGKKKKAIDWDILRKQVQSKSKKQENRDAMDSIDYEALRCANVTDIADSIKERGMNNMLAERIKEFLNRLVREHGSTDLEWLREVPPDKAKDFLLSMHGLGLKSVECVRLLTLHHLAFPVDTNVGRIAVRLGWVPLQPLPESLQLHLLELYPVLESIQKFLWPRLCKLDQQTLYELHYQLITFGKVFCTKRKPNCNACPMRGECRHFASAFARKIPTPDRINKRTAYQLYDKDRWETNSLCTRLALPGPEEKSIVSSTLPTTAERKPVGINLKQLPPPETTTHNEIGCEIGNCVPMIEEPATPGQECTEITESDIEDAFYDDPDEIPTIKLNIEEFTVNLQNYIQENMELQGCDMSKALVALHPDAASIPVPKLKNVSRLRTEHQVYGLPDSHPLLERMDRREPDDPSPYLLAIWTPGETADSIQPPETRCKSQESGKLCDNNTCFSCNSVRETNSQIVRGTLLIPCRTAMRGSFPLNGTYFQVNEVFADHDSSHNPIDVPREWLWNLPRRTVYFGTSVSMIFKGLSTEEIQFCFWKGFVCVRGFDQKSRAPRPLMARLHFPASKLAKEKKENKPQAGIKQRIL